MQSWRPKTPGCWCHFSQFPMEESKPPGVSRPWVSFARFRFFFSSFERISSRCHAFHFTFADLLNKHIFAGDPSSFSTDWLRISEKPPEALRAEISNQLLQDGSTLEVGKLEDHP